MGKPDKLADILDGIGCFGARPMTGGTDIDSIGTVQDSGLGHLLVGGRSQQFHRARS